MAHEEWRDVVGYEGLYQVSNLGHIKRLERLVWNGSTYYTIPERHMKPNVMKIGYCRVTLTKDSKQEQFYVHRLVANAFIPNSENLPEVDHIDAVKTNNAVSNLRWVSHLTNIRHCKEMGRQYDGSRFLVHGFNKKPVVRSDGQEYESIISASKALGYSSCGMVSEVLSGRRDQCRGYSFRFKQEDGSQNASQGD